METAVVKMYVKRKLKNTYTNFTVGEFLRTQKLGKHPLSTESRATHTEMALRMQSDQRYSESMGNIIADSSILQKDIDAYKSGDMMTMLGHVAGNYDWSKDYWKLIKQQNGKYGLEYDGNHSLLDEAGNILIKNDMDLFDEEGNITGQKKGMSYSASLGMLLGTYTDYFDSSTTYRNNRSSEGNELMVILAAVKVVYCGILIHIIKYVRIGNL